MPSVITAGTPSIVVARQLGPAGPTGPTGPAGPAGPTGAAGAAQSFTDIATTQAATIGAAVKYIEVAGYYAFGDGGVANYKRVAAEPFPAVSAQGTGKVRSTDRFMPDGSTNSTNGGWWEIDEEVVNVHQFGAKGDGVTDDAASIFYAIYYASVVKRTIVHFFGKTYLAGPITMPAGGDYFCTLYGLDAGVSHGRAGAAVIKLKNGGNGHQFTIPYNSGHYFFERLVLDGNGLNQSAESWNVFCEDQPPADVANYRLSCTMVECHLFDARNGNLYGGAGRHLGRLERTGIGNNQSTAVSSFLGGGVGTIGLVIGAPDWVVTGCAIGGTDSAGGLGCKFAAVMLGITHTSPMTWTGGVEFNQCQIYGGGVAAVYINPTCLDCQFVNGVIDGYKDGAGLFIWARNPLSGYNTGRHFTGMRFGWDSAHTPNSNATVVFPNNCQHSIFVGCAFMGTNVSNVPYYHFWAKNNPDTGISWNGKYVVEGCTFGATALGVHSHPNYAVEGITKYAGQTTLPNDVIFGALPNRWVAGSMEISSQAYKPGGGPWNASSDSRVKTVVGPYTHGLAELIQLDPVTYTYLGNDTSTAPEPGAVVPYPGGPHHDAAVAGTQFIGLTGQDIEGPLPECVTLRAGYINGSAVSDIRIVDTTPITFALVNAVKEISTTWTALLWKGPWSAVTPYSVNDVVSHGGSSYVGVATSTNVTPGTDSSKWQMMAAGAGSTLTDDTILPAHLDADTAPKQLAFADRIGVLSKANGGTVAGPLLLTATPTAANQAVPKSYVDARVGTAGLDALAYSGMQINGSFEVDQPNAGASVAVAAGTIVVQHLMDGWYCAKSGTNAFSVQQTTSVFSGYAKELKLTITTAQASIGSDVIEIKQSIEGYRASRLAWGTASAQPLTIGFWIKSSVAGTLVLAASNSASTTTVTTSVTIASAGVAEFMTATFAAQTSGTWLADNNAGIILFVRVAASGSINVAATVGNTFEMTGFVVLPGSLAPTAAQSPLIMRPYDQELMTCQRYYRQQAPEGAGLAAGTASVQFTMRHHGMRATPSVSATGVMTVSNILAANFVQSSPNVSIGSLGSNADWGEYQLANFAGLTGGASYVVRPAGLIKLDARL